MKKKNSKFLFVSLTALLTAVAVLTAGCMPKPAEQDVQQTPSTQESLPAKDVTVEEMLKHLKLDGVKVGLPCKVKDLPKTMELRKGYNMTGGRAVGDLYYNGKKAGTAHFDEFSEMADSLKEIDMGTGYEEEVIHAFSFRMDCFDILGVTYNDRENDVITKLGQPTGSKPYATYSSKNNVNTYLSFYFTNEDNSMSLCQVSIAKENTNE